MEMMRVRWAFLGHSRELYLCLLRCRHLLPLPHCARFRDRAILGRHRSQDGSLIGVAVLLWHAEHSERLILPAARRRQTEVLQRSASCCEEWIKLRDRSCCLCPMLVQRLCSSTSVQRGIYVWLLHPPDAALLAQTCMANYINARGWRMELKTGVYRRHPVCWKRQSLRNRKRPRKPPTCRV